MPESQTKQIMNSLASEVCKTVSAALGRRKLETLYLAILDSLTTESRRFSNVVLCLIDSGATRAELIALAVRHGHPEKSIRSLISKILCGRGARQRKKGAGRKANALAKAIADFVSAEHGDDQAQKLLRAAARILKARAEELTTRAGRTAVAGGDAADWPALETPKITSEILIVQHNNNQPRIGLIVDHNKHQSQISIAAHGYTRSANSPVTIS